MTTLLSSRLILPGLVLTVLGLLIVLLAVGSPDRASAQSQALVSNLDAPANGTDENDLANKDVAQGFTTGSHAAGYTLTSVEVDLRGAFFGSTAFTAAIHANNAGRPGSKLATLTATRDLFAGTNRFTHAGLDLAPSTSYFVVIETSQSVAAVVSMTRSTNLHGR